MPRNPQSTYSETLVDFSNEKAVTSVYVAAYNVITNPNLLTTLIPTYRAALADITLCEITSSNLNWFNTKFNATLPTDPNAQREDKWLVRYQDNVNFALYRVEIPGAKRSIGMLPGTDLLDLTGAEAVAYVDAFQAMAQ